MTVAHKAQAHAKFKEELYNIAGISTDDAHADVQLTGEDTTIALDAFFDFDKHDIEHLAADPTVMQITSKETVNDEFHRYLHVIDV